MLHHLLYFAFALVAVITGQFYFSQAVGSFFLVIVMGTLIGLTIGMIFIGSIAGSPPHQH